MSTFGNKGENIAVETTAGKPGEHGTKSTPDRLYKTIASVLGVSPDVLTEESAPGTPATWDSLNHLLLVMALESEFGISLTPENALEMRNVGMIRSILRANGLEV